MASDHPTNPNWLARHQMAIRAVVYPVVAAVFCGASWWIIGRDAALLTFGVALVGWLGGVSFAARKDRDGPWPSEDASTRSAWLWRRLRKKENGDGDDKDS